MAAGDAERTAPFVGATPVLGGPLETMRAGTACGADCPATIRGVGLLKALEIGAGAGLGASYCWRTAMLGLGRWGGDDPMGLT